MKLKDIIKFIPLLLIYIVVILIATDNNIYGDGKTYVMYAKNLSHGYYSPLNNVLLNNGPGYPLVLVPFVLLELPWLFAKLMNGVFLFIAILYFYNTLRLYMQERSAFYFSYLLGIYTPFIRYSYDLLTESLAVLLVCGFIYHYCKLFQESDKSWVQLLVPSLYLGYLALTKIMFGYVILLGVFFFLFLYLLKRRNIYKKTIFIYLLALFWCIPYLSYTYSVTGKVFYWGNCGGILLYIMSTPFEDELGDWYNTPELFKHPQIIKNHGKFFDEIKDKSFTVKDQEYKKRAIENIINYPQKYFKNWVTNVGRLLFNYPYSKFEIRQERQLYNLIFYMIPNMILIVIGLLCTYPAFIRRRMIPYEIYALIIFNVITFGIVSLVSIHGRYFLPFVPMLVLWISFVLTRTVDIKIRNEN